MDSKTYILMYRFKTIYPKKEIQHFRFKCYRSWTKVHNPCLGFFDSDVLANFNQDFPESSLRMYRNILPPEVKCFVLRPKLSVV